MKTFKRILIAALVLFGTVLLVITCLYLLVGNATLFSYLVEKLESSSDLRVVHWDHAQISRTLTPTLTVDDLVITDTGHKYRAETASLKVQVSLPRLLLRELDIPQLIIGNSRVEIKEEESPAKPAVERELKPHPQPLSLPLTPILHDVSISRITMIYNGRSLLLPGGHVSEFTLELNPDNSAESSAQVVLARQKVGVKIGLRDVNQYFEGQPLDFKLGVQRGVLNLSLAGQVDFAKSEPTVEATVRGGTGEAEKIVIGSQDIVIPGNLTLAAQLKGTFAELPMEEISVAWHGPKQSAIELNGRVANVIKLQGVQLNLTGKLNDPAWLTPLLPKSLGAVKSAGLAAQITGSYPMFAVKDLDFRSKTEHDLNLSLSGKLALANFVKPANIAAELVFNAPDTRAARFLLFEEVPELGAITGRCEIHSTVGAPTLENVAIQTKDKSGIQANLSGEIAQFPLTNQPNRGYNLEVSIQATEATVVTKRLGLEVPAFGPLDLNFRIEGSTPALKLNQIKLTAGREEGVHLGAQGQMSFGDWNQADPLESIDLEMQAQSHTARALSTWIGHKLPELGKLSAEARLHTVSGGNRLEQIHIGTSESAPLQVTVTGSAEKVTLLPELRVQEIKLVGQASTDDTEKLNRVFGLTDEVPSIGPFKAQARIAGDEKNLVIDEVSMAAGKKDLLLVNLRGRLGRFSAANQWQPQDTSLSLRASSSNSHALFAKLGYPIPELGPLAAQADIFGKNKKIFVDSAQLSLGEVENPVLKITGQIKNLVAMKGIKGDARLHMGGRQFAAFVHSEQVPELGALTGRMIVSDSNGSLGIDFLEVQTSRAGLLSLKLDGSYSSFKDPSTLRLNSSLSAKNLQLLGKIFDRQWPDIGPVRMNTQVKDSGKGKQFDSELTLGQSRVETKIVALFETTPMRISGTVKAQELAVWKLLEEEKKGEKKKTSRKKHVFSKEPIDFNWLKKVDADIAIEVESFAQEQFLADSAQFRLKVKSGLLSLSPARLIYAKGKLDMNLELDAWDNPSLTFTAFGKDLDTRRTLDIQQYKEELGGEMNVDVNLHTSGQNPHELAANSQGSIYITMQNGKIPVSLTDLVFLDIAGWAWHKTTNKTYYDITCGVADYSIDKGVISTKAFILDSASITVTGGGTINLRKEKIDYFLLPKKKSDIIQKANPVDIKGRLSNPEIRVIPWKSAAITAAKVGGIIFAPYIFIPLTAAEYLAGKVKGKNGGSACQEYRETHKMNERPQQLNRAAGSSQQTAGSGQ